MMFAIAMTFLCPALPTGVARAGFASPTSLSHLLVSWRSRAPNARPCSISTFAAGRRWWRSSFVGWLLGSRHRVRPTGGGCFVTGPSGLCLVNVLLPGMNRPRCQAGWASKRTEPMAEDLPANEARDTATRHMVTNSLKFCLDLLPQPDERVRRGVLHLPTRIASSIDRPRSRLNVSLITHRVPGSPPVGNAPQYDPPRPTAAFSIASS